MSKRKKKHDIRSEPQFNEGGYEADRSELPAEQRLANEKSETDANEQIARHSVFDEPATLPNRQPIVIDRDWSCRKCGYNLRGLMTNQTCPECGEIPRYEPARDGEVSLATFLADRRAEASGPARAVIFLLVIFASIPIALILSFLGVELTGFAAFVIFGPVVAEILRIAPTFVAVERYAFRFKSHHDIMVLAVATSIICAVAQNLLFVTLFFKGYPADFYLYRWTVGVGAHVACGVISARGLQAVWRSAAAGQWPPRLRNARTMALVAGIVHASWNVIVFLTGKLGYGF